MSETMRDRFEAFLSAKYGVPTRKFADDAALTLGDAVELAEHEVRAERSTIANRLDEATRTGGWPAVHALIAELRRTARNGRGR